MKKICSTLLLIVIASTSHADSDPTIKLNGGSIAPRSELSIPLNQLQTNVKYTVSCTLTAAGSTALQFRGYATGDVPLPVVALNANLIGSLSSKGVNSTLNGGDHGNSMVIFAVEKMAQNASINIRNRDNVTVVVVTKCIAELVVPRIPH